MSKPSSSEIAEQVRTRFDLLDGATPGPWKAGRDDMATLVEGYESKWIYAGHAEPDYHRYIALASGMEIEDWSQVMANAHLIAAAPALRDALITASVELEELRARIGQVDEGEACESCLHKQITCTHGKVWDAVESLLQPLKEACDRDWEDETPIQIVAIAANAIHWRGIAPAAQAVIEYVRRHHDSRSDKLMQMIANYDEACLKWLGVNAELRARQNGMPPNFHGWRMICACCGCAPKDKSCKFNCVCHHAPGADAEVREGK